jgi:hypothetical protein
MVTVMVTVMVVWAVTAWVMGVAMGVVTGVVMGVVMGVVGFITSTAVRCGRKYQPWGAAPIGCCGRLDGRRLRI